MGHRVNGIFLSAALAVLSACGGGQRGQLAGPLTENGSPIRPGDEVEGIFAVQNGSGHNAFLYSITPNLCPWDDPQEPYFPPQLAPGQDTMLNYLYYDTTCSQTHPTNVWSVAYGQQNAAGGFISGTVCTWNAQYVKNQGYFTYSAQNETLTTCSVLLGGGYYIFRYSASN